MSAEAAQRGAAKALAEVLRRRQPQFSWEVTIGTGSEHPTSTGTGEVGRLVPGGDDPDEARRNLVVETTRTTRETP